MAWKKKGLIFRTEYHYDWMSSHAQVPIAEIIDEKKIRIYFGTRNAKNQTVTSFIEVARENPKKILYIHDRPVLSLGNLGCFDDSGSMPSWLLKHQERMYLYYTGWNIGVTVPYRNSIGVAVSDDKGLTFQRLFDGPILDRISSEPYLSATPCVIFEDNIFKMWYLSGTAWKVHANNPEPYYHIKYAESKDGIYWKRDGIVCIDFKSAKEGGIARPSVIKSQGLYKMWYSYRGGRNYRTDRSEAYRIGYAESEDGLVWVRKDDEVDLELSKTGWDSDMMCYPYVIDIDGKLTMFYNGNGFGKSGIGYAVLEA